MLFLTDPKYHVRIVHGLRNHFPNTMFVGVLLWKLIEVLLRNMSCLAYICLVEAKDTIDQWSGARGQDSLP